MITHFETTLKQFVDTVSIPATKITQAIRYVLFPGGKRLRPQLVYLTGELLGVPHPMLDPIAISVELTHAYSLVHDDLPAMDNDDFRRGQPSCHMAFDEACAILTGDALQSLAITALTDFFPQGFDPNKNLLMIRHLLKATGPAGMISGQALDLSLLCGPGLVDEVDLQLIHQLKTSALMQACIQLVIDACDTPHHEHALLDFGHHLGLAYQMQDDYLDAYAPELLGKGAASDKKNDKQTFATIFTKDMLKERVQRQFQQAEDVLQPFGKQALPLKTFSEKLCRIHSGTV